MPRVLLILPTATYRATAFLQAAQALGVEVVTASERPQALASVMGDRFVEIPLEDPEAAAERIARQAARHRLDAVLAVDDQGLLAAALAAERLGLAHNPVAAVAATRDKAAMRAAFAAAGVPQPGFRVVGPSGPDPLGPEGVPSGEEHHAGRQDLVEGAIRAAAELGYPVVVKPTGLSASRGVIRADDETGLRGAVERVLGLLGRLEMPPVLLLEEYVPGEEVALEALCDAGRLEPLALFDKPDPLEGPYFEETLYVTPSRHLPADQQAVVEAVRCAAGALGIGEGPVHAEARLSRTPGGPLRVVVIELAARTIGGRCAAALRFAAGASLETLVLDQALGRPVTGALVPGASGVMMLPIPATGRLQSVDGIDRARKVPGITGVEITVPLGRRVVALPEGDRYLGFLFARADHPAEVESALRRAHGELDVHVAGDGGVTGVAEDGEDTEDGALR